MGNTGSNTIAAQDGITMQKSLYDRTPTGRFRNIAYTALFIAITSLIMVLFYFVLWGSSTKPWDYEMGPAGPLSDYWLKARLEMFYFHCLPIAIMIGISASILFISLARWKRLPADVGIMSFYLPAILTILVIFAPLLAMWISCFGVLFTLGMATYSLCIKWRWPIMLSIPFNILWMWKLYAYFGEWWNLVGD